MRLTVFPADGEADDEFHDRVIPTSVLRSSFVFCFAAAENRVSRLKFRVLLSSITPLHEKRDGVSNKFDVQ
jgi:hypothetical protein